MSLDVTQLSAALQGVAGMVDDELQLHVGQPVAFVLVCQVGGVAQYVANAQRQEGEELLRSLLERWESNRADIPAHMNPNVKQSNTAPGGSPASSEETDDGKPTQANQGLPRTVVGGDRADERNQDPGRDAGRAGGEAAGAGGAGSAVGEHWGDGPAARADVADAGRDAADVLLTQKPVAWVRFCTNGGIEGPILDSDRRMNAVRREFWTPLYAAPVQSRQPIRPAVPSIFDARLRVAFKAGWRAAEGAHGIGGER